MDNLVFALDFMRRLGEEFTGGLLSEDILLAIGRGEEVGRV